MKPPSEEFGSPILSRRGFLAAGGVSMVGLSLRETLAAQVSQNAAVIQIVMSGGASQLETFDPKPHAPREIRGPLHSIATRIPGVRFSECLPRLADRADQLVVLRGLSHGFAPLHAPGLQLLLSGHVSRKGSIPPAIVDILQSHSSPRRRQPLAVRVGRSVRNLGATASLPGSSPAWEVSDGEDSLAMRWKAPQFEMAAPRVREAYGDTAVGRQLWTAVRCLERNVRYVCVPQFDQLEGARTWDAHGCPQSGPATVFDYRDTLGPQFDRALSACLDDLQQSGFWQQTLIVCTGEMGRTPRLNEHGGRGHWTRAWSGLLAGGLLPGGRVCGETDEWAEEILDGGIDLAEIPGLILQTLGIVAGSTTMAADGTAWSTPGGPPLEPSPA